MAMQKRLAKFAHCYCTINERYQKKTHQIATNQLILFHQNPIGELIQLNFSRGHQIEREKKKTEKKKRSETSVYLL